MDDIARVTEFYLDPFEPLLRAWVQAEGGPEAFVRCIRCSPQFAEVAEFPRALAIGAKTIRNRAMAYCQFCKPGTEPLFSPYFTHGVDPFTGEENPRRLRLSDTFIEFLGARIAPLGASNDPDNLNANWVPNVQSAYLARLKEVAV